MKSFEAVLQEYYIPQVTKIIKRHFPEYHERIKNLPKDKRKGIEPLTDEEVIKLHKRYIEDNDTKARDILIYSQLSLVCYITKGFYYNINGTKLAPEDLLGFANYILVKLIDTYDPYSQKSEEEISKGIINKFPSYIQTWLRFNLYKELKNFGLLIKLPHNRIIDISNYKHYLSKFANRYGREPYDGEQITFHDKGDKYNVVFKIYDKEIEVYKECNTKWKLHKKFPIQPQYSVVSGNEKVNESDGNMEEFFDLMPDNSNENDETVSNLISNSINDVLEELNNRERELLILKYIKRLPAKNIPSLLTPDLECKRELKRLEETSKNEIHIYIRRGSEVFKYIYNVISNYHIDEGVENEVDTDLFEPISHKYKDIRTNVQKDKYTFSITDGSLEKVVHVKTNKMVEEIITPTVKEKDGTTYVEFDVNYNYGHIFTSQTLLNQKKKLEKKLRRKLIHLKQLIYE